VRSVATDRLKALGHHDRLLIVEVLAGGGRNVSEIAASLRIPNATVSRHLRVLHDAHVVECSRRGNFVLYVLADREVARLAAVAYSSAGKQARRLMAFALPR
jgi:DNA-binding transcriptional ArsR family regulator